MVSVNELVDEWITDNKVRSRRSFSSTTERAYRGDLERYAETLADLEDRAVLESSDQDYKPRHLDRISVADFSDKKIALVFTQLVEQGLSPASRGRLLSAMRGFCRWLVKQGHLAKDPTEDFETPQVAEKLPVAFTQQELQRIFEAAASPSARFRSAWATRDVAILGVLAGCGLRSSELTDMTLASIDRNEPMRVRVTGKGNKDRVVPISTEIVTQIDKYLKERQGLDLGGKSEDEILFVRKSGKALNNQALQNLVDNWLSDSLVPKPIGEKAHAFRHTYAVAQLQYGTNPAELQALLGHKNLATTSQYLRMSAEGLHHTARATAVNEILAGIEA